MTTVGLKLIAQDFTFSQFYEMPLLRNPALAGIYTGSIRIQSAYRNQWASVTVPFETKALSAEVKFPIGNNKDFATIGTQINYDRAGDSKLGRTQIEPVFNFHKELNEYSYLSFALTGSYTQSHFDPTSLRFNDQFVSGQYNPLNPTQQVFTKTSFSYMDGGTGLAYSSATSAENVNYYVGIGAYHLLKPKVSFYDNNSIILQPRYVLSGGLNLTSGDFDDVYIYGDIISQGGARQFLAGMLYSHVLSDDEYVDNFGKTNLIFGATYRWADALIPILKLEMRKVSIGASYDINVSKLRTASMYRGGFEITLSFRSFLNSQDVFSDIGNGGLGGWGNVRNGMSRNGLRCAKGF